MDRVKLVLGICLFVTFANWANAAPIIGGEVTTTEEYPIQRECVYQDQRYPHGASVETAQPCLNCTCNQGALVCFLRICHKLVVPPNSGCKVTTLPGKCCSEIVCDGATSPADGTTTAAVSLTEHPQRASTASRNDASPLTTTIQSVMFEDSTPDPTELSNTSNAATTGCAHNGSVYADGSAMPSPIICQYCYCIRGSQRCIRPQCHLRIEGCRPIYHHELSCCPMAYKCGKRHYLSSTSSTTTTTMASSFLKFREHRDCRENGTIYKEGEAMPNPDVCQNCFCVGGEVRCSAVRCTLEMKGCRPIVQQGKCCPTSYDCSVKRDDTSESVSTTLVPSKASTVNADQPITLIPEVERTDIPASSEATALNDNHVPPVTTESSDKENSTIIYKETTVGQHNRTTTEGAYSINASNVSLDPDTYNVSHSNNESEPTETGDASSTMAAEAVTTTVNSSGPLQDTALAELTLEENGTRDVSVSHDASAEISGGNASEESDQWTVSNDGWTKALEAEGEHTTVGNLYGDATVNVSSSELTGSSEIQDTNSESDSSTQGPFASATEDNGTDVTTAKVTDDTTGDALVLVQNTSPEPVDTGGSTTVEELALETNSSLLESEEMDEEVALNDTVSSERGFFPGEVQNKSGSAKGPAKNETDQAGAELESEAEVQKPDKENGQDYDGNLLSDATAPIAADVQHELDDPQGGTSGPPLDPSGTGAHEAHSHSTVSSNDAVNETFTGLLADGPGSANHVDDVSEAFDHTTVDTVELVPNHESNDSRPTKFTDEQYIAEDTHQSVVSVTTSASTNLSSSGPGDLFGSFALIANSLLENELNVSSTGSEIGATLISTGSESGATLSSTTTEAPDSGPQGSLDALLGDLIGNIPWWAQLNTVSYIDFGDDNGTTEATTKDRGNFPSSTESATANRTTGSHDNQLTNLVHDFRTPPVPSGTTTNAQPDTTPPSAAIPTKSQHELPGDSLTELESSAGKTEEALQKHSSNTSAAEMDLAKGTTTTEDGFNDIYQALLNHPTMAPESSTAYGSAPETTVLEDSHHGATPSGEISYSKDSSSATVQKTQIWDKTTEAPEVIDDNLKEYTLGRTPEVQSAWNTTKEQWTNFTNLEEGTTSKATDSAELVVNNGIVTSQTLSTTAGMTVDHFGVAQADAHGNGNEVPLEEVSSVTPDAITEKTTKGVVPAVQNVTLQGNHLVDETQTTELERTTVAPSVTKQEVVSVILATTTEKASVAPAEQTITAHISPEQAFDSSHSLDEPLTLELEPTTVAPSVVKEEVTYAILAAITEKASVVPAVQNITVHVSPEHASGGSQSLDELLTSELGSTTVAPSTVMEEVASAISATTTERAGIVPAVQTITVDISPEHASDSSHSPEEPLASQLGLTTVAPSTVKEEVTHAILATIMEKASVAPAVQNMTVPPGHILGDGHSAAETHRSELDPTTTTPSVIKAEVTVAPATTTESVDVVPAEQNVTIHLSLGHDAEGSHSVEETPDPTTVAPSTIESDLASTLGMILNLSQTYTATHTLPPPPSWARPGNGSTGYELLSGTIPIEVENKIAEIVRQAQAGLLGPQDGPVLTNFSAPPFDRDNAASEAGGPNGTSADPTDQDYYEYVSEEEPLPDDIQAQLSSLLNSTWGTSQIGGDVHRDSPSGADPPTDHVLSNDSILHDLHAMFRPLLNLSQTFGGASVTVPSSSNGTVVELTGAVSSTADREDRTETPAAVTGAELPPFPEARPTPPDSEAGPYEEWPNLYEDADHNVHAAEDDSVYSHAAEPDEEKSYFGADDFEQDTVHDEEVGATNSRLDEDGLHSSVEHGSYPDDAPLFDHGDKPSDTTEHAVFAEAAVVNGDADGHGSSFDLEQKGGESEQQATESDHDPPDLENQGHAEPVPDYSEPEDDPYVISKYPDSESHVQHSDHGFDQLGHNTSDTKPEIPEPETRISEHEGSKVEHSQAPTESSESLVTATTREANLEATSVHSESPNEAFDRKQLNSTVGHNGTEVDKGPSATLSPEYDDSFVEESEPGVPHTPEVIAEHSEAEGQWDFGEESLTTVKSDTTHGLEHILGEATSKPDQDESHADPGDSLELDQLPTEVTRNGTQTPSSAALRSETIAPTAIPPEVVSAPANESHKSGTSLTGHESDETVNDLNTSTTGHQSGEGVANLHTLITSDQAGESVVDLHTSITGHQSGESVADLHTPITGHQSGESAVDLHTPITGHQSGESAVDLHTPITGHQSGESAVDLHTPITGHQSGESAVDLHTPITGHQSGESAVDLHTPITGHQSGESVVDLHTPITGHQSGESVVDLHTLITGHQSGESVVDVHTPITGHQSGESVVDVHTPITGHQSGESVADLHTPITGHQSGESVADLHTPVTGHQSDESVAGLSTLITGHQSGESVAGLHTPITGHQSDESVVDLHTPTTGHQSGESVSDLHTLITFHQSGESMVGLHTPITKHQSGESVDDSQTLITGHQSDESVDDLHSPITGHQSGESVADSHSLTASQQSSDTLIGLHAPITGHQTGDSVVALQTPISSHQSGESVTNLLTETPIRDTVVMVTNPSAAEPSDDSYIDYILDDAHHFTTFTTQDPSPAFVGLMTKGSIIFDNVLPLSRRGRPTVDEHTGQALPTPRKSGTNDSIIGSQDGDEGLIDGDFVQVIPFLPEDAITDTLHHDLAIPNPASVSQNEGRKPVLIAQNGSTLDVALAVQVSSDTYDHSGGTVVSSHGKDEVPVMLVPTGAPVFLNITNGSATEVDITVPLEINPNVTLDFSARTSTSTELPITTKVSDIPTEAPVFPPTTSSSIPIVKDDDQVRHRMPSSLDLHHESEYCVEQGEVFQDGERIPTQDFCTQCRCVRGIVQCQHVTCTSRPRGCIEKLMPSSCCPAFVCNETDLEEDGELSDELPLRKGITIHGGFLPIVRPPILPTSHVDSHLGEHDHNDSEDVGMEHASAVEDSDVNRHPELGHSAVEHGVDGGIEDHGKPDDAIEVENSPPDGIQDGSGPSSTFTATTVASSANFGDFDSFLENVFGGQHETTTSVPSSLPKVTDTVEPQWTTKGTIFKDERVDFPDIAGDPENQLISKHSTTASTTGSEPNTTIAALAMTTEASDPTTAKVKPELPSPVAGLWPLLKVSGCNIYGRIYQVGSTIGVLSGPCKECKCGHTGVECYRVKCF